VIETIVAIFLEILDEIFNFSALLVFNWVCLVVTLEEVQSGESLNSNSGNINFISSGIDLGDGDLVTQSLYLSAQLLEGGSQLLAVTTPRSIELNQHIVIIVQNQLLEGFALNTTTSPVVSSGYTSSVFK